MKLQILVLRDIKANLHEPPMFVPNINAAIRDLQDMVNDTEKRFNWQKHPEDFELWHLAEWDNENAVFEFLEDRKQLCALSTLKA